MALTYSKEALSDGITLTSITDERFKTNYITINLSSFHILLIGFQKIQNHQK